MSVVQPLLNVLIELAPRHLLPVDFHGDPRDGIGFGVCRVRMKRFARRSDSAAGGSFTPGPGAMTGFPAIAVLSFLESHPRTMGKKSKKATPMRTYRHISVNHDRSSCYFVTISVS